MLKYSLGIDVSKASFHACLSTIDAAQTVKVQRSGTFANNENGFTGLTAWIAKEHRQPCVPLVVVMEATGIYYERLAFYLYGQHHAVSVVLPNKAKKYVAALGIKTKNDVTDAKALARMGAEQALDPWQPMGEFFYGLRALTRYYEHLQGMATALGNQAEAISVGMQQSDFVTESNAALLARVRESIKATAKAISAHIARDETVKQKVSHITAIAGVGELTAAVLLAETNGFALFTNARQLVSYSGYDVVENQSGRHVGRTKISKRGNGRIRRCLYMPAMSVVRWEVKVFRDLYERVYERSGVKMKGYVAVQKKLLTTTYALWKNDCSFDDQYWNRNNATKTTSDEEAEFSSRHTSPEAEEVTKKLAPSKGRAKQGIQPSDESASVSSRHNKAKQEIY